MGKDIKVSVVIPSYNREKTIEACLLSVLNQSYPPFEIIVVDDGSTDNTIQKIEGFNDSRIRILRQQHKGAQAARNCGIKAAKGDYIAFLDSDDEWLPEKLEIQIQYLKGRKDVVVYCDGYEVNRRKGYTGKRITTGGNGNVYKEMLMNSGPMFQGMLCSKCALMDIGLLDENVPAHQEWETSIRLSLNNEFVHICQPLFKWNWHMGETISKDTIRGIKGYAYIIEKHKWQILKFHGLQGLLKHYENLLNAGFLSESKEFQTYFLKWMLVDSLLDVKRSLAKKND